jgi:hypothetical protein
MKKSKLLIVGLIALMLVGGLILAGCENLITKCPGDGNCSYSDGGGFLEEKIKSCGSSACAVESGTTDRSSCNCVKGNL